MLQNLSATCPIFLIKRAYPSVDRGLFTKSQVLHFQSCFLIRLVLSFTGIAEVNIIGENADANEAISNIRIRKM
jgi:hypothetical protein